MPVVRRIVNRAAAEDYRFLSIVMAIVESSPFQKRTKFAESNTVKTIAGTVGAVRVAPARRRAALIGDHPRSSYDHFKKAFVSPYVSSRSLWHYGGIAFPGCYGAGALGSVEQGEAVLPVWRRLHAQRHLSAVVASGKNRERLCVSAHHEAARAVPRLFGNDQQD